jgi:hypothetical protein
MMRASAFQDLPVNLIPFSAPAAQWRSGIEPLLWPSLNSFHACGRCGCLYARQNKVFSPASVKAIRTIRFCAIAVIAFAAGGEIFIMLGNSDNRAGGIFMGILIAFGSIVVVAAAAVCERVLLDAMEIKLGKGAPGLSGRD